MKVQCEFDTLPATKEFMKEHAMHQIFALLVQRVVRKQRQNDPLEHPRLVPNHIRIVPFTTVDGQVKYAVDSSVSLAEAGRLKVREDVFETAWDKDTLGMINSDTGDLLIPNLGAYRMAFVYLNTGHALEAMHQQNNGPES